VLLPLILDFKPQYPIILRDCGLVTQSEFLSQVLSVANRLPDSPYIVNLCRDRYFFAVVFCASLIKGITNLLPPNRQPAVVSSLLAEYDGSVCVTDSSETMHDPVCLNVTSLLSLNAEKKTPAVPMVSADFIAAIAFTSGSTGKPNPSEKRWGTLTGTASMLQKRLLPSADCFVIVATVPTQHMYGLEMTLMMALYGHCIISAQHPFYPQDVMDTLDSISTDKKLLVSTPVHLRAIAGTGVISRHGISKVVSATAPLANETAQCIEEKFSTVVEEVYGCTEAGSMATRRTTHHESWTLLDGMKMRMSKDGPVVIGPQLDGERWLQDNLDYLGSNQFRFIGRSVDMINVGGKRASLADLTQKILSIADVKDAVVFLQDEKNKHNRPAALVVSSRHEREILKALEEMVDAVFLPRPLKRVGSIPRNETGKVSFQELRKMLDT